MEGSVADARANFAELLAAAGREPQFLLLDGRRVAVVLDAATFEALCRKPPKTPRWPSLGDALDDLQRICEEERYQLEVPHGEDPEPPSWEEERSPGSVPRE